MANLYNHMSSPSSMRGISSSMNLRNNFDLERQYLAELLAEHQKLGPFMQVLPICSRLLSQEILRVSGKNAMIPNQVLSDFDRMQLASPSMIAPSDIIPNCKGWNSLPLERLAGPQGMNVDWKMPPVIPNSRIVKRMLRLDVPTDIYPTFNFIGRLLGPRGHSLKHVEAVTGCRAYIRGKGSMRDQEKEELLRRKAGYEHLNEPLHILIEAELPASIVDIKLKQAQDIIEELLKPVEESQDFYKRQPLRELAMLNSKFYRE